MIRKQLLVLVLLSSTSCIFGGGKEKNTNNDDNNTNNETDAGPNNENNLTDMGADVTPPDDMEMTPDDMSMPPDMTRPPDMPPPVETYLSLDADEQPCASPRTFWFSPSGDAGARILGSTYVATANEPFDVQAFGPYLDSTASVAFATKDGSNISIYAAAVAGTDAERRLTEVVSAETNIDTSAELYGITLTPRWVQRTVAEPIGELFDIMVNTSDGVQTCSVTVDMNDNAQMTCAPSPWNQIVTDLEITQPERLDPAPVFTVLGNGDYGLSLLGFDLIAAVSGPAADGGEVLGLLNAPLEGAVSEIDILGVDTKLTTGTFAERLAFGVTPESFAHPVLLMLHADDRGLQPIALRANDLNGRAYSPYDLGMWQLSSRLAPERGDFTFVDAYDISLTNWLLVGLRFPPETATFDVGYAAIQSDDQGLVFARPGGFGGQDFLEFPMTNALEIVAFKNIPQAATATGRSPIAVIHGANRDRLAVFDWGFSTDATYIADLLEPEFSNAQRMASNWWFNDSGTISMLAQRNMEWVIAAVTIENLNNLTSACE